MRRRSPHVNWKAGAECEDERGGYVGGVLPADRQTTTSLFLEYLFMHLRPLHDRIIVRRLDEDSTQRIGGIIIPDSAKEKPLRGTVLAAGVGKSNDEGERVPLDVKAGDTILFGKYSGQEVSVDGIDYLIMKEDDVLAVQEGSL
jgi:chaperonin GroES